MRDGFVFTTPPQCRFAHSSLPAASVAQLSGVCAQLGRFSHQRQARNTAVVTVTRCDSVRQDVH